jgi:hypothetical protein
MKFKAKKGWRINISSYCIRRIKLLNNYINHFVIIKYNLSSLNTFNIKYNIYIN